MMKILFIFGLFFTIQCSASVSGWNLILEEDGIKVFGKKSDDSGIIPFKAESILNHSRSDVTKVIKNADRKVLWSPKLYKVVLHKKFNEDLYHFSEYYSTPWPAYNREFLLEGEITKGENLTVIKAKSIKNKSFENDDLVQANVKYINIDLHELGPNKTKISFSFLGDMGGWMPVWLMNIIQKKWPLRFIQGLRTELSRK